MGAALKNWWGLGVALVLLALWTLRPIGVNAPAAVDSPFDSGRAISRLKTILGDERPHPTDSDANDAVEARLLAQIRAMGFTPIVRDGFHCNTLREGGAVCGHPRNILFWVTPPGPDAVALMSHHDSVPAGPGAADDGIGVAISLEVAHLLKGKALARPLLVLITDAEEAGLIGASAFAANDPLRKQVGAVVNVEARGTTGGASMFQTSRPNSHDVQALVSGGQTASANALATDFFELLPNDTDLTMLLPLGVDGANYSIIGGGKRYHTPLDNLAHLDRRSVAHMGESTLATVTGFATSIPQGVEDQRLFTDLARQTILVLPQWVAGLLVGLGLGASILLFWWSPGGARWKSALVPPLALVAGVGSAFAVAALVAAIRADDAYGTAWPQAMRLAYGAAAVLGGALAIRLLREQSGVRLAAASWAWLAVLILAAFAFVPGLSILAAWPLLFVIAAAGASRVAVLRPFVVPLLLGAALLFGVIVLPLAGGLEEGLFIENAAPISFLMLFLFLFLLPAQGGWRVAGLAVVVLVAAVGAALLLPAYGPSAPRHLTVIHEDKDNAAAFLIDANGPLPAEIASVARFAAEPFEGKWRAPAPRLADDGVAQIVPNAGDVPGYSITLNAPSSDRQELLIEKGEAIRGVLVNGQRQTITGVPTYIGCGGRRCRTLTVDLQLAPGGPLPELRWRQTRFGAGPAAAPLVAGRPETAQPVHVGDRQVLIRPIELAN